MDQPILLSPSSKAAKGTVYVDDKGNTSGGKVQTTRILVSLTDELKAEVMKGRLTVAVSHMPRLGLCGGGVWGCCVGHCAGGGAELRRMVGQKWWYYSIK